MPLFIEIRRFTQWGLWFILYGLMCIPLVGLVQQVLLLKPFGNKPMSDTGLLLFTPGMVLKKVLQGPEYSDRVAME